MARNLTKKQEAFVQLLIQGYTQRQAYIKAGYSTKNMTNKTIDECASRLLKNPKVYARYEKLRHKVIKKAEEEAIMSAIEVLKEIESIAKDDISNYLEFRTENIVVGYEDGEPVYDYRTIVDMKDSRDINTKNISEVSIGANGTFKFKMYCRDTALYKLAELLGADVLKRAKQKLAEERFLHEKDIDSKRYF